MVRSLRPALALAGLVIVTFSCLPALAWNDTGHMISAYIAWGDMKPEVRQQVGQSLKQQPRYKEDLLRERAPFYELPTGRLLLFDKLRQPALFPRQCRPNTRTFLIWPGWAWGCYH